MNLRWIFRRTRPAVHVTKLTRSDILTAHAWGLTLTEWAALDDRDRAHKRLNVCSAPGFLVEVP